MRSFLLAGVPRIGGYMTLGRAVEAEVGGWPNLPPASERRAMAA